jgi:hypothetical protein
MMMVKVDNYLVDYLMMKMILKKMYLLSNSHKKINLMQMKAEIWIQGMFLNKKIRKLL